MKGFEPIRGEVAGFCKINELKKIDDVEELRKILGSKNVKGYRYVMVSGGLRKTPEEWKAVIKRI